MSRTMSNSRNIFSDAEANLLKQVPLSLFDSPVSQSARRLYSLPTREDGLRIRELIDNETEYAVSLTACAPLEDEDRINAHLTQERITHNQRFGRLSITRSSKKDLMGILQTEQRHVIKMTSEKGALK